MEYLIFSVIVVLIGILFWLLFRLSRGSFNEQSNSGQGSGDTTYLIKIKSASFPIPLSKQDAYLNQTSQKLFVNSGSIFFNKNIEQSEIRLEDVVEIKILPVRFMIGRLIPFVIYDVTIITPQQRVVLTNLSEATYDGLVTYIEKMCAKKRDIQKTSPGLMIGLFRA